MKALHRVPFRIAAFAAAIRDSYWFVPALLAAAGLLAGVALVTLDARLGETWLSESMLLHGSRPEGARAMLSTIAGSTITVAGVVFSITLAAVTYAAGQHGPRLLTNFARDRGNQVTLGVFIGTYVYCLIVLRTVRSASETGRVNDYFVPDIAVYGALGLALVSIAMLIYFVHHVTQTIHINNVVAQIGKSLIADIRANAVDQAMLSAAEASAPAAGEMTRLRSASAGYVQGIDYATLSRLADRQDVVVSVECQPGDFIRNDETLLTIHGAAAGIDDHADWLDAITLGSRKTDLQDLRFGFDELTEIATRALSPGINDPFTAIGCIDWLGAALSEYDRALAAMPDKLQRSRLVVPGWTFADYVEASFGRLRQHASTEASVTLAALGTLADVAAGATIGAHRAALFDERSRLMNAQQR